MKRLALLLALAAVTSVFAAPEESQAQASRPNIVLILTDDQRWDTVHGVMSVVESELIGRGIEFENAFVTDPLCCPSRASILTGRYPHGHGVYGNNNGPDGGFEAFDDSSTIATWLDDEGYRTGMIGKYLNGYEVTEGDYVPPGWDRWFALVEPGYFDYTVSDDGALRSFSSAYSTDLLAGQATSFVYSTPPDDPLFLMFAPYAMHAPFRPALRHEGLFAGLPDYRPPSWAEPDLSDKPRWLRQMELPSRWLLGNRDERRLRQLESLLAVDEAIARILDALEIRGRLENTLFVYTSDNGFQWGEHRLWGKHFPYEASTHVPLVMRYDGHMVAPRPVSHMVANIDLAPTIAAVAGITPPTQVDGLDLTALFADPAAPVSRTGVLIEHGFTGRAPPFCAYRTRRDVFIHYATGEEEYYRYRTDPYELENQAESRRVRSAVNARRATTRSLCSPLPPGMTWR